MSYFLQYSPQAKKELDRLSEAEYPVIAASILALQSHPRPLGSCKLKDKMYRIRAGRWRVIYAVFDKERAVCILRVAQRNEKTYRGIHWGRSPGDRRIG